jgi:hypothetical protein
MRAEGMPALSLISTILERPVKLRMMEDNEAMIKICQSGKNPTMRYLNQTRKVGVSWLMEVFQIDGINIYKVGAKLQVADIGTKRIICSDTWRPNCILINFSEPRVDATQQRTLLSLWRRDAIEKLHTREEPQWVQVGTCAGSAAARGGVLSPSSKRKSESRPIK